jgi:myo-inositol-1(or 4)-monophosphatase
MSPRLAGLADALLPLAERAARHAGHSLLTTRHQNLVEEKSSATDLVSEADRRAELLIRDLLERERPTDSIVGEELGPQVGSSSVTWIVDPLDGTSNYLRGYPGWAVSIAAEHRGTTLVGVVYDPVRDLLYHAALHGAAVNEQALRVAPTGNLEASVIGLGFSYDAAVRARQGFDLAHALTKIGDVRRGGSAALELCYVASGALDGFIEDDLQPWDWAAGAHIVRQAGGLSAPVHRDGVQGIIAATPRLWEPLHSAFGFD